MSESALESPPTQPISAEKDLSDMVCDVIKEKRGSRGCLPEEILGFLHNRYNEEFIGEINLKKIIACCQKLVDLGRMFRQRRTFRLSLKESGIYSKRFNKSVCEIVIVYVKMCVNGFELLT